MQPRLRPYAPSDLEALSRICLATGDAGRDATALYRDPGLIGAVYAAPYGVLQPACALVTEDEEGVGGYVLGAPDTRVFERRLETEWWPALRARYRDPGEHPRTADEKLARHIHHPPRTPRRIAEAYPAHLHIDLLLRLQGQGLGKRMLDEWLRRMAEKGVRAVHLATGPRNERAMRFYSVYGFHEIERMPDYGIVWFGIRLARSI